MPSTKGFLLEECKNVRQVLEETLRYKYGPEGSREFYEECQTRLAFVEQETNSAAEIDAPALASCSALLENLSGLIWRIERSSLGEYSWPFVNELKRIATSICTEATASGDSEPLIHVFSQGGLSAYAIYPEPMRPGGTGKRILTIVFPTSLKHFVLFHPILGHEVGHAIYRCVKHQSELTNVVRSAFMGAGALFENPAATGSWLFSPAAPNEVRAQIASLAASGIDATNFFTTKANWSAWIEEILCDLIGILTFGPSFIAAESNLLYALDPSGEALGPDHPPVCFRTTLMLRAAGILGFSDYSKFAAPFQTTVQQFWDDLATRRQTGAWFDAITDVQLAQALAGISNLLSRHPPALYNSPAPEEVEELCKKIDKCIPPVSCEVEDDNIQMKLIDFRHILYAGWVSSKSGAGVPFRLINRLCEHGIMQQKAIEMQLGKTSP